MSSVVIAGDTSGSVTLQAPDVSGSTTLNLPASSATLATETSLGGYKNKIIGGDFQTNPWQRGTSFTAPLNAAYSADRFLFANTTTGVVNILKTTDAPTAAQAGVFTQFCLHVDVTTADAAIAAGEYGAVVQNLEGLNVASFGFGQAGTRYVTLSFWHKHTKTGVYCAAFRTAGGTRSYVAEYTQDVSDTWEKATITIPVDTTGTWLYNTGVGLEVWFTFGVGTTYQTTVNTWSSGNFLATANQVNALDSTANNFKIALVQLEAGQVATPFETRSVGQELALCQRYFNIFYLAMATGTDAANINRVQSIFRASPTVTVTGNTGSGATFVGFNTAVVQSGLNSNNSSVTVSCNAEL